MNKDSLIRGTLILTIAALVARALGLFQRIPLDYLLDDVGLTYFNTANNIYLLLLVVATGGIPSAISRMIAARLALGHHHEARRIVRAALGFGAFTGLVLASALYVFAGAYARMGDNAGAQWAIQAIAPSLILFPMIAMLRGYFQGHQFMKAGGISQIIEQIARVCTAIGLALVFVLVGYSSEIVAAGAAAGSVFGSVGAMIVMLYYTWLLKKQSVEQVHLTHSTVEHLDVPPQLSLRHIYREIFSISVPIVVAAMTVQFVYNVDTSFFYRLTDGYYATKDMATDAFSALGNRAQALAGIPPIIAIALSTSIIPIISSAFTIGDKQEVSKQVARVVRMVLFTGVPIAVLLSVNAYSVTTLLFKNADGYSIVAALVLGTIVQMTMMTSNSILFGLGKTRLPMYHTLVGLFVKIVGSIALAPWFGAYGLIVASTMAFALITWLNLRAIGQVVDYRIMSKKLAFKFGGIMAATATVAFLTESAIMNVSSFPVKLVSAIALLVAGLFALLAYIGLIKFTRMFTSEELNALPYRIRKLFR